MLNTMSINYYFFYDVFLKDGNVIAIGPYYPKIHFPNHTPILTVNNIQLEGTFLPDRDRHTLLYSFNTVNLALKCGDKVNISYCNFKTSFVLEAEKVVDPKKKYHLSISTTMKNENKFLKSWLDYNIMVGFEHFYLYDNNSDNKLELNEILDPYIQKGQVTLIDWSFPFKYYNPEVFPIPLDSVYFCQIVALNHCIHKYGGETEWLLNTDPDEYMIPKKTKNITDILKPYDNLDICGLYVHDYVFGPSDSDEEHPIKRFIKRHENYAPWLCGGKVITKPKNVLFGELHTVTNAYGKQMILMQPSVVSINHYHFNKKNKDTSERFNETKYHVTDLRAIDLFLSTSNNFISMKNFGGWARLGNQMFQYAYLRSMSINNNLKIKLHRNSSPFGYVQDQIHDAFDLNIEQLDTENNDGYCIQEKSLLYDSNLMVAPKNQNIFAEGYFQSEKYFSKYFEIIREDFKFKNNIKTKGDEYINNLQLNIPIVALHVRRGDNLGPGSPTLLVTDTFYKNAIKYIDYKIPNYKLLIFSDDKKWCQENFSEQTIVDGLSDLEELYVMTRCNHFIIGSSSFSWWGAWLSHEKNKIVISPNKWFSEKIMNNSPLSSQGSDILPSDWIKLEM